MRAEFVDQILEFEDDLRKRAETLCRDSGHSAEDLFQDALIKAALNEDKFKPGTNLRAWLQTIIYHLFVNRYRRKKRYYNIVESEAETLQRTTSHYKGENQELPMDMEGADEVAYIQSLLQRSLDPMFYEVINEVDIQSHSYQTASENLEVPLGTVMSRLHRARRHARDVLVRSYSHDLLIENGINPKDFAPRSYLKRG